MEKFLGFEVLDVVQAIFFIGVIIQLILVRDEDQLGKRPGFLRFVVKYSAFLIFLTLCVLASQLIAYYAMVGQITKYELLTGLTTTFCVLAIARILGWRRRYHDMFE